MQAEQFAAHARVEDHHWWFTARRAILLRLVTRIASPGAPVADIGCGTGGNAGAMAAAGFRVVGLDPSDDAIRLARERFPAVAFQVGDDPATLAGHLTDGGVVLLTDVLEHVADDRHLLAAALEALPAGGHAVVTVPADPSLWSAHDVAFGHFRRYDLEMLQALLAGLPVQVRLLAPFNARLRPLVVARRRWARGLAGPGGDLDVPAGPFNRLLHRIFAGEGDHLVAALDRGTRPYRAGVSLVTVLRRQ